MAQYQVPQFIEVEDKIFGPFTLRQFIYLAGGGGFCLLLFSLLPLYLTVLLGVPVMALAAGLAFFQINGRPLIYAMEHGFGYLFGSKLYLWQQRKAGAPAQQQQPQATKVSATVPKLSESKLRDLSWSLNIKDRTQEGASDPRGFEL
jgi:hypothetical protein